MNRVPASFPVRRSDGMIVKELADEVLVYDSTASKAFCLNKTSAIVWNACDGHTSVAEIATRAEAALVCRSTKTSCASRCNSSAMTGC